MAEVLPADVARPAGAGTGADAASGQPGVSPAADTEKHVKRRPPSLVIESEPDKDDGEKRKKSAKEIIQGLALHCVSPGLPPMDYQMLEQVKRTREIEQQQRRLIASRQRSGSSSDNDEPAPKRAMLEHEPARDGSERTDRRAPPPPRIKIVEAARYRDAGYERAIRSAPLTRDGRETPRVRRHEFVKPPVAPPMPVPASAGMRRTVPGGHARSQSQTSLSQSSLGHSISHQPHSHGHSQRRVECEKCAQDERARHKRARRQRFLEICSELYDLLQDN